MQEQDVFDMLGQQNWDDVSTAMPVLEPGIYELEVVHMETKTSETKGTRYIELQAKLLGDATAVDGAVVNAGYPVRHIFGLTKSDKFDPMRGLAEFMDAVVGERRWDPTYESYIGQQFMAKTKVSKPRVNDDTGEEYPPKTEISRFLKKS